MKFNDFVESMDGNAPGDPGEPKKSISYTAVVLDEASRTLLLSNVIPALNRIKPEAEKWKVIAHHMTINLGPMNPNLNEPASLGSVADMKATHLGVGEKVAAIAVDAKGVNTINKIQHITLAVDFDNGGKPFHSNQIENWHPLSDVGVSALTVKGLITEVPN